MSQVVDEIYQSVLDGNQKACAAGVQKALDENVNPEEILTGAMIASMAEVGKLFEEGEYFVPELLVSARAMQAGMNVLKPLLVQANIQSAGKVVAGTVQGDLHDIGKNLVCMMLEGAGFEIVDLGSDVKPEQFIEAVQSTGANIVAMSALLTTTMPNMKTTIEAIKSAGIRENVKVMVGGAPLTQQYADEIGADGYAQDANRAVAVAKSLLG